MQDTHARTGPDTRDTSMDTLHLCLYRVCQKLKPRDHPRNTDTRKHTQADYDLSSIYNSVRLSVVYRPTHRFPHFLAPSFVCGNVTGPGLRYYHIQTPHLGPTPPRGPLAHPVRTVALGGDGVDAGGDAVVEEATGHVMRPYADGRAYGACDGG